MVKKNKQDRQVLPTVADLLDKLTVDQLKEVLLPGKEALYAKAIADIEHDLDLLLKDSEAVLDARLMRLIIILAQMNCHVWYLKDLMQDADESEYLQKLKLAHQLNGLRNQIKNHLNDTFDSDKPESLRTNFNTDGLEGWQISL